MKLLCTGDLHLGRTSTRVPTEWRREERTLRAWRRLVDFAVREKVDALILSGDVVDQSNKFWETLGPLTEGVRTLAAADIPVVAVAGNHDAEILPEIADQMPPGSFHLLGRDGTWERFTLKHGNQPALHIVGWSFPSSYVRHDPTETFPDPDPSDDTPVLGLVHGDPDAPGSSYAPLDLRRLQSLPVNGWLLGHIHRPLLTPGATWVLMPGSPHPLDPGEPGAHSAWMVHVHAGTLSEPVPACPARLRYDTWELPFSPGDPVTAAALADKLRSAVREHAGEGRQLIRVRLTGRVQDYPRFRDLAYRLQEWEEGDVRVERVLNEVTPALDLDRAASSGPVPRLLVEALHSLPPDLESRLQDIQASLETRKEYDNQGLPPLDRSPDQIRHLLENILATVMEERE